VEAIEAHLPADAGPVRVLAETASTNTVAKTWAVEDAPHGAMVAALRQTGGKGRLGRQFQSPPGGLYMSVVLRPAANLANPALATAATAVAVCRSVQALCGPQLGIKWVNDLYYRGKKCCGILCEAGTGLETGRIEYIVAGIGINYTTNPEEFVPEVASMATSLYPSGNAPIPRAQLAAEIHTQLLKVFATLPDKEFLPEYRARSIVLGRPVTVLSDPPYLADAIDIDDEARLVVESQNGQRTLSSGEISIKIYTESTSK
jgi:BirA family biotin operon repressor/biotin-[acetyl-CoA-carboxylase] ligase